MVPIPVAIMKGIPAVNTIHEQPHSLSKKELFARGLQWCGVFFGNPHHRPGTRERFSSFTTTIAICFRGGTPAPSTHPIHKADRIRKKNGRT
jgi:hypothetical protein